MNDVLPAPFSLGIKLNLGKSGFQKGESRLPVILQKKVAAILLKPILYAIWLIVADTYTRFQLPLEGSPPPLFRIVQAIGGNERFGNMGFPAIDRLTFKIVSKRNLRTETYPIYETRRRFKKRNKLAANRN